MCLDASLKDNPEDYSAQGGGSRPLVITSCSYHCSGEPSSSSTISIRNLNEDNDSRSDKIIVYLHAPLMYVTSISLLSDSNDKPSKCLQLKSVLKESWENKKKLDTPSLDLDFPVLPK